MYSILNTVVAKVDKFDNFTICSAGVLKYLAKKLPEKYRYDDKKLYAESSCVDYIADLKLLTKEE